MLSILEPVVLIVIVGNEGSCKMEACCGCRYGCGRLASSGGGGMIESWVLPLVVGISVTLEFLACCSETESHCIALIVPSRIHLPAIDECILNIYMSVVRRTALVSHIEDLTTCQSFSGALGFDEVADVSRVGFSSDVDAVSFKKTHAPYGGL